MEDEHPWSRAWREREEKEEQEWQERVKNMPPDAHWIKVMTARETLARRLLEAYSPEELAERLAERIHDDEVLGYFNENNLPQEIRQRGYR